MARTPRIIFTNCPIFTATVNKRVIVNLEGRYVGAIIDGMQEHGLVVI